MWILALSSSSSERPISRQVSAGILRKKKLLKYCSQFLSVPFV